MIRSHPVALVASAVVGLALPAVAPPAEAAAPGCVLADAELVDHVWRSGYDGYWSEAASWSDGKVPGRSVLDHVCIPDGVTVTMDISRADVAAFELGRGATLRVPAGSALYVSGVPETQPSLTQVGSTVDVAGGTLGGPGLIQVDGTVRLRGANGSVARLSTGDTPGGRLEVLDDGSLDVRGTSDAILGAEYTVDVYGRVRLMGRGANLLADHDSRFTLLDENPDDDAVGRLVILNDQSYIATAAEEGERSVLVNQGRIEKLVTTGSSVVDATYWGGGDVLVERGYLVLPQEADELVSVSPGASVGSGTCADASCVTDASDSDPQFASLTVPATAPPDVQVAIEALPAGARVPGDAIGAPMKVHATGLQVSKADPVVIELRYDSSLLEDAGLAADPALVTVARAPGPKAGYVDLEPCTGGVPTAGPACVDYGASRAADGDVVMVVRTTRTSRWIAH